MTKKKNGYSLKWETLKHDWPVWVILGGLFAAGAILYPVLPENIPVHWNLRGVIDNYESRFFATFISPLLILGVYVLLLFLPMIDPLRRNYVRFENILRILRWLIIFLIAGIYSISLAVALGYIVPASLIINGAIAVSFIIVGYVMKSISPNYFFGIRTPWTLANEEVWKQTHQLASKVWVIGGLVCLAVVPVRLPWGAHLFVATFVIMVLVPLIYSYLIYRRLT